MPVVKAVPSLSSSLQRLDASLAKCWGNSLLMKPQIYAENATDSIDALLQCIPDAGLQIDIGGNSFEFVGRKYIQDIQYQFANIDAVRRTNGIVFITQQDFNPIFLEQGDSGGTIRGGLAGAEEFGVFGESLNEFVDLLVSHFVLAYETFAGHVRSETGVNSDFVRASQELIKATKGVSPEAWFEYFYG
jgi:hypothetical protein